MKAMTAALAAVFAVGLLGFLALPHGEDDAQGSPPPGTPDRPAGAKSIVLAGGCFWCVEAIFEELAGVLDVESAYVGGTRPGLTYQDVGSGRTGAAEAVRVLFDPQVVSEEDILRIFFTTHDPTTLNRQGNDVGTQYRSAVFYDSPEQKALAERVMAEVAEAAIWPNPLVTTLEPLANYTRAEDYHQDYFRKFESGDAVTRAGMNVGYCSAIVEPKVRKFRQKYADRLKKRTD